MAASVAHAADQETAIAAIEAATKKFIGHRLFTVMAFDGAAMRVQRLYSSDPEAYPTGGSKEKRDTAWGRHVLEDGKPFIGRDAEAIRANFDDHELIIGLGLESILNMPVKSGGRVVGTMNLLHRAGYYDPGDIDRAAALADLLSAALSSPTDGT